MSQPSLGFIVVSWFGQARKSLLPRPQLPSASRCCPRWRQRASPCYVRWPRLTSRPRRTDARACGSARTAKALAFWCELLVACHSLRRSSSRLRSADVCAGAGWRRGGGRCRAQIGQQRSAIRPRTASLTLVWCCICREQAGQARPERAAPSAAPGCPVLAADAALFSAVAALHA